MIKEYPALDERLYKETLPNGLTVAVVPRPGFQRKLAYFVTDYGSVHQDFCLEGQTHHAPAGVAHFLEHKMFELPDRDVSEEFAALGAHVNAFTSYDMTAYYFSCTEHFEESLALLLEFVSTPWFPEESVQREMGIIDQEIGMNEDTPENRVFEKLTEVMYRNHPIRVPILGTSESIRQITAQTLMQCHQAFYSPGNMILCVVGDVSGEEVAAVARRVLGDTPHPKPEKLRQWPEEMTCSAILRSTMEVSMPMFQLGFKCEPCDRGEAAIRQEIIGDLAAEALFGESSALYLRLYEEGLIDSSFGGGFETVDGCAMLSCGGDSENAEQVREELLKAACQLCQNGIPEADFLRMKRSTMGRRVRSLDSFDSTAFRICAYHFANFDYFAFPSLYGDIRAEEILTFINNVVREERCVLSIIEPKEEDYE